MFLGVNRHNKDFIAVIDDSGNNITYGELCLFTERFVNVISERVLIFIVCENSIGAAAGFIASLTGRIVPLLLGNTTDRESLIKLTEIYKPQYIWTTKDHARNYNYQTVFKEFGYELLKTDYKPYKLYNDLSFLLPTSGSTGSPKLVRHSYRNIEDNSRNVAEFFELSDKEIPIAALPIHYTMGLSVLTSHLYSGSTILLTKRNLTDKEFWEFIRKHKATSFTGVPFSFEILYKLRFLKMDLPHLKLITQGGGKLRLQLFKEYADYAYNNGKKFIATYGQTEGTARMAYLPAELAREKLCSIGKAIPNGELSLVDEKGNIINEPDVTGQLVFKGSNVTLGYANSCEDLLLGDENRGILYTGDLAKRDKDGCYYIIGRMKRFLKLYGLRIGLDEIEEIIRAEFETDVLCTGNDEQMTVKITRQDIKDNVLHLITEKTGLFHKAIQISYTETLPKNETGKVIYN